MHQTTRFFPQCSTVQSFWSCANYTFLLLTADSKGFRLPCPIRCSACWRVNSEIVREDPWLRSVVLRHSPPCQSFDNSLTAQLRLSDPHFWLAVQPLNILTTYLEYLETAAVSLMYRHSSHVQRFKITQETSHFYCRGEQSAFLFLYRSGTVATSAR